MKKQGYNARMDESLGMRRGKESGMKQSYKARRDESRGMKKGPQKADYKAKGFNIKDNAQASKVMPINSMNEQYDLGKVKKMKQGSRGYPAQAWGYDY
jgi:hypothetical protein